jgi:hypothetical protein
MEARVGTFIVVMGDRAAMVKSPNDQLDDPE